MASSSESSSQSQQQNQQQQSYFTAQQQQQEALNDLSLNSRVVISPSILLIIVILAVVFFVSGLLHLLVRFLLRPPENPHRRRNIAGGDSSGDAATALQGQLRQLFHLHDAGVDQTFIDALPVFVYSAIIGSAKKKLHDCAVCLCEFDSDHKLRLLPKCSHAFHVECIDTWLLSHSTCPLCRSSLLFNSDRNSNSNSNFISLTNPIPFLFVLESDEDAVNNNNNDDNVGGNNENCVSEIDNDNGNCGDPIVRVKLGKFKKTVGETGSSSSVASCSSEIGVDSRRCFSMGSFAYVVDESSELRVPIRNPKKGGDGELKMMTTMKKNKKKRISRAAISECDCESKREFEFGEIVISNASKTEKKAVVAEKEDENCGRKVVGSRKAFSFRFMRNNNQGDNQQRVPRRTVSEIGVARREDGLFGRELTMEESDQSFNSLDSQSNPPSFARKTLLWLMGRQQQQNKVVHSSSLDPPDNNV